MHLRRDVLSHRLPICPDLSIADLAECDAGAHPPDDALSDVDVQLAAHDAVAGTRLPDA
jgi:hypothetical protein